MGGQILGDRYEVEYQLGKTSGRWTLKARQLDTDTDVILKLIFLDDDLDETDLRLFKREIEALKLLCHPATPRYLDYFEMMMPQGDSALALVQSFVPGKSVATYLAEGRRFTEPEAIAIAAQTLHILSDLHSATPPIIHRDIRPSNLLLRDADPADAAADIDLALVDFGSVKSLTGGTTAFTMVGTDGYIPPEQAGGRVLAVSDLYALGVTLLEAITGQPPHQLRPRGLRFEFEDQADLSPDFTAWLKQLVAPGLDHRWRSAQAALDALEALRQ